MRNIDILVPDLPESVTDATIISWHKKPGDIIMRDEILVEIETDKVILEISSPENGILELLLASEGSVVTARQVIGKLKLHNVMEKQETKNFSENFQTLIPENIIENDSNQLSPSMRRTIAERSSIENKNTIIDDVIVHNNIQKNISERDIKDSQTITSHTNKVSDKQNNIMDTQERKKYVPMTRLRKRIAERLLNTIHNTAMLTTFNEVNMKSIMCLRKQYGEIFEKKYSVRLGLMSFFVKAVLEALKKFPIINASIDGENIVYYNYFDISIAVSTSRGLVTPILKNVNTMSIADIEQKIRELAIKGRDGKLTLEELTGGNITITNGGVFGSLMSTPIINPPQSSILGMHAIKDRPMAVNSEIVILPMMYLSLSYDHRIIDGQEAVGFLVTIKEILEDPIRFLIDV